MIKLRYKMACTPVFIDERMDGATLPALFDICGECRGPFSINEGGRGRVIVMIAISSCRGLEIALEGVAAVEVVGRRPEPSVRSTRSSSSQTTWQPT